MSTICLYSCKTLYAVSDANCILKSVLLNKFDQFAGTSKGKTFLERCSMAENPEALYCNGMVSICSMLPFFYSIIYI